MPYYKDQSSRVHYLDDEANIDLLPSGSVAITNEEADALRAPKFSEAQEAKRIEIRSAYAATGSAVVANGVTWDGGFDSAIKLDAAKRLAEAAGASDVTFFDAANAPHVLDFATAQSVIIGVASAFQAALATKQALMRAINDAQTESDLYLVEWPQ